MPHFLTASLLPTQKGRPTWVWLWACGFLLLAAILVFRNVGNWLVAEDPLQEAAAIAVLSGDMPGRALEAARVYKRGYARQVWLTHSTEPGATLAKISIPYISEDTYDRQILTREGVPPDAIHILDPPIVNTVDEMRAIGTALHGEKKRTVILVTSPVHTRRTRVLWKKISGQHGVALLRAVSDDPYDGAHWWRTTHDALDVVRELLGLANAWAGLPLQPS